MNIEWTLEAKTNFKNIFKFYSKHFSKGFAKKPITNVFNTLKTLELGTILGQEEGL